ncbi:MAG: class B sortase [Anaerorhabdus sp.]
MNIKKMITKLKKNPILIVIIILCFILIIFQIFNVLNSKEVTISENYAKTVVKTEEVKELEVDKYSENQDFRFVLELSDQDIPVFQSSDNEDYLRVDYLGNYDSMGSLFLDYRTDYYLNDRVLIVYGHSSNKKDTMFTKLSDSEYILENEYYTINSSEGERLYQVVSYYQIEDIYNDLWVLENNFRSLSVYATWLDKHIAYNSLEDIETVYQAGNHKTMIFVTCDLKSGENARYIVVALDITDITIEGEYR